MKFFRFQANKEQTEKWIHAVNRKNWSPTEYSRVGSDHFATGKQESLLSIYNEIVGDRSESGEPAGLA